VGASTGTGERCDWVHPEDYDFLLPGDNVPLDLHIDDLPTEHSGSSIATALASGLGGLLLYLSRYSLEARDLNALGLNQENQMQSMLRYLASYNTGQAPKFPQAGPLSFLANKIAKLHKEEVRKELRVFFKQFKVSRLTMTIYSWLAFADCDCYCAGTV
jgi:hypothetical protein